MNLAIAYWFVILEIVWKRKKEKLKLFKEKLVDGIILMPVEDSGETYTSSTRRRNAHCINGSAWSPIYLVMVLCLTMLTVLIEP